MNNVSRIVLFVGVVTTLSVTVLVLRQSQNRQVSGSLPPIPERVHDVNCRRLTSPEKDLALSDKTGEGHSLAVSSLVELASLRTQLSASELAELLAFISSPKPANLNDGEWEERVNVILNLLRTQSGVFDDGSDGQGGVFAGASNRKSGYVVPGLSDVLLEMAANNPSKVLRLYAMQHLSLWFPRESDGEKRRQMVELLESISQEARDETAGCAVLMLADMRREEIGIGTLDVPNEVNGIDWKRVDQVIADASQQLVGEKAARADVRISAIHTCVDRKDGTALPAMRQIAEDVKLVSPLRKAAIYAIGQLGNSEDLTLLASLPQDDGNLSLAVLPAQKELELKFAQESLR